MNSRVSGLARRCSHGTAHSVLQRGGSWPATWWDASRCSRARAPDVQVSPHMPTDRGPTVTSGSSKARELKLLAWEGADGRPLCLGTHQSSRLWASCGFAADRILRQDSARSSARVLKRASLTKRGSAGGLHPTGWPPVSCFPFGWFRNAW